MNYLEHTTILKANNKEYKLVRLQKYNNTSHKSTNKYYVDGKLVTHYDRFDCQSQIDNTRPDDLIYTTKSWVK